MLLFRTILLWLAFSLLILRYFISFNDPHYDLWFMMLPSGILLLWFLLSFFIKEKVRVNLKNLSKIQRFSLLLLRPSASLAIIAGAVLKLLTLPYGNLLLVSGIGFMALYSTLLSLVSIPVDEYNPEIIDDTDEEE